MAALTLRMPPECWDHLLAYCERKGLLIRGALEGTTEAWFEAHAHPSPKLRVAMEEVWAEAAQVDAEIAARGPGPADDDRDRHTIRFDPDLLAQVQAACDRRGVTVNSIFTVGLRKGPAMMAVLTEGVGARGTELGRARDFRRRQPGR